MLRLRLVQIAQTFVTVPRLTRITSQRTMSQIAVATLPDLLQAQKNNDLIIDVREVDEIKQDGAIRNSVNIPLGEIEKALDVDPNGFKERYQVTKPQQTTPIIFSCRSGRRSYVAAEIAVKKGFENVKNFNGGWLEYKQFMDNA